MSTSAVALASASTTGISRPASAGGPSGAPASPSVPAAPAAAQPAAKNRIVGRASPRIAAARNRKASTTPASSGPRGPSGPDVTPPAPAPAGAGSPIAYAAPAGRSRAASRLVTSATVTPT